jgi:stage II sporulation protein GA (sporulation sigma-E factor processing peptidase)
LGIASIIGAIYAVISYMSILKIYSNIFLKLLLSVIMIYIAYKPKNVKILFKNLLMFYLASFVFGGVAFSLIYLIRPQDILIENGMFVGTYSLKVVMLSACVGFVVIYAVFKFTKSKINKNALFCNIKIVINKKEVETKAMIDSGNCLKDPISGMPVIVVEHTVLYEILPKIILDNLNKILGGEIEEIPKEVKDVYMSKLKVIPFSSLGKQNGMLIGIRADKVLVEYEEEKIEKENVIVGIYNKSLTKRGEYRALIGIELI